MKNFIKNITISTFTAASLVVLTGCGGTIDSNDLTSESKNSYQPIKISREYYDGVDSDNSNAVLSFEVANGDIKLSISNFNTTNFVNNQLFINTDNNRETGLGWIGGADYLIENGNIFKSTGTNWSWRYIGKANTYTISDDLSSINMSVKQDKINLQSNQISVVSIQRDGDWQAIEATKKDFTINQNGRLTKEDVKKAIKKAVEEGRLPNYIDADISTVELISDDSTSAVFKDNYVQDYYVYHVQNDEFKKFLHGQVRYGGYHDIKYKDNKTITYIFNSYPGGAAIPIPYTNYIFRSYNIDTEVDTVTKTFQHSYTMFGLNEYDNSLVFSAKLRFDDQYNTVDPLQVANFQFFINSDDNIETGYANYNGADFLIENGSLYKSIARNWSWEKVTDVDYKIEHGQIKVTLNKNLIEGLTNTKYLQYTFLAKDSDWNILINFYQGEI